MLPALRNGPSSAPSRTDPVNRLLDTFFRGEDWFRPFAPGAAMLPWSTWEDENNVYVEVDAPGIADKDIDVSIEGDELVIRAERKSERKTGGYDARTYGTFEQRLSLPTAVDRENVEARLAGGVLFLRLAKSALSKPHKIEIKAE